MEWSKAIAYIVGAVLSAAGLWKFGEAVLGAVVGRGGRRVDAVERLSDKTLAWVTRFEAAAASAQEAAANAEREADTARQEAVEARHELRDTRREATEAMRQVTVLRGQIADLTERMGRLQAMIHSPEMTIERLRWVVPPPVPNNGN